MSTPNSESLASSESDFGTKYSQIIDYTEQIGTDQETNLRESFQRINQICSVIEETFRETKTTSDYLLDMNALASTTIAAKNLAKNVNSKMRAFNPIDFAHKLLERYQNERGILDLHRLHKYGDNIINRTTFNPIVLNTFVPSVTEIEQKKRVITRREKDKVAEKKTSEKVAFIEKTDPTINEIVIQIYKCLDRHYKRNGERPISFFHFTIDPTSYTRTIENIFHTSFLLRDNRAKMNIGPDELPTIQPIRVKGPGGKDNGGEGEESSATDKANGRKQMFVELTPAQHQIFVEALGITASMIPSTTGAPVPLSTVQKRQSSISTNIENKHKKY
ncbi:EP300-interacting inhibitor of differentiation 3-like isoform X1 [Diaphorina citri]|uniref:Non-structural maintenance of chromosomes element 4 n=1 Tax=Diaphorina citri TaxID=121845 RepID=A0A1S3D1E6_DIACI|nr:EP300-interacting inhibitor of differentiation 3-like isoform X2 [Diaphorina citri]XP_026679516.1 EP300-interacting inhibitor of differentiation 3-like isoform X1 [Diaphorina citri]